ncbi:uncharacterized protein PV09_07198 [Verruconis gallopava]|uniref:Phosphoribulokinase/uridine kinase domain-containing protein n=1 Tax=Verruconis gallopava TaxID=253628 RepID=A0A0D2A4P8_9PEZI|nr:uncharacterized protein PV09_07198 [Verruconis gallopava]KIW01440.1 hypothetical protein PV09_07198 [Verruconis gallopava]
MPHFDETDSVERIAETLYERLVALKSQNAVDSTRRILVAVAGVPGSGKTTITTALSKLYESREGKALTILPMDGFHYSRAVLQTMPDPHTAFQRRGAAFTFDVKSFIQLVRRLRNEPVTKQHCQESSFKAPSFDHAVKDPVEDDIQLSSAESLIILEGNYLLLDEDPWNEIATLVDEKWFVDAPESVAKERVVQRHLAAGIEKDRAAAEVRVRNNDLLNGRIIRDKLIKPDLVINN